MQIEDLSTAKEPLKRPIAKVVDHSNRLELAEAYVRRHLKGSFSLLDLSRASGTSPSTLLRLFNAHHGVSPMQYVKRMRLEAVRQSLLAANPLTVTIGRVASAYGFRQMGQFSAHYRNAFGELPSETLRSSG